MKLALWAVGLLKHVALRLDRRHVTYFEDENGKRNYTKPTLHLTASGNENIVLVDDRLTNHLGNLSHTSGPGILVPPMDWDSIDEDIEFELILSQLAEVLPIYLPSCQSHTFKLETLMAAGVSLKEAARNIGWTQELDKQISALKQKLIEQGKNFDQVVAAIENKKPSKILDATEEEKTSQKSEEAKEAIEIEESSENEILEKLKENKVWNMMNLLAHPSQRCVFSHCKDVAAEGGECCRKHSCTQEGCLGEKKMFNRQPLKSGRCALHSCHCSNEEAHKNDVGRMCPRAAHKGTSGLMCQPCSRGHGGDTDEKED